MEIATSSTTDITWKCVGFEYFSVKRLRHCNLIRVSSDLKVTTSEAIWNLSKEVCDNLPNKKIAGTFIQYWIMLAKGIKSKGNNDFVISSSSMHCDVSKGFMVTKDELIQIDKEKEL